MLLSKVSKTLIICSWILSLLIFSMFNYDCYGGTDEDLPRILIMPLKAQDGVDKNLASILSDLMIGEIYDSSQFMMFNHDSMKALLTDLEFSHMNECDNNICLLDNVKQMKVSKIIAGSIGLLGRKYIIAMRIINEDGSDDKIENEICDCDVDDLDIVISSVAEKLMNYLEVNLLKYARIAEKLKDYMESNKVEESSISDKLQKYTATLKIESIPSLANVFIDGIFRGTTPLMIDNLTTDFYKIKLKKVNYKMWQGVEEIVEGQDRLVTVRLKEEKALEKYKSALIEIEFSFVKGGCYLMGSELDDSFDYEKPVHEVCVNDFYIGKYEIRQKTWKQIMGNNPSKFSEGGDYPVEQVSWNEVQEFINRLNKKNGEHYRLPTEAEWEYAARERGKDLLFGNGKNVLSPEEANFNALSEHKQSYSVDGVFRVKTTKVGSFMPNALDIYDMTGNVWEWCSDWYGADYYKNSPRDNPKGLAKGSNRVVRGGGWFNVPRGVRSSIRSSYTPENNSSGLGFRLAKTE